MELMPGYKLSDVGVIPDDWDDKPLGEIGESLIGLTYRPCEVRPYGTLVLRSSNVQNGALCFGDNVFVDTDIPDRIMVRPGDILVCVRNGSRDLIGKSALIDERAVGMTFGAFMAVFRSEYGHFPRHVFQSGIFKKQINEHLDATIDQITNKSLNFFKVLLPPTKEERTEVTSALSDVDALLVTLDQVIAKKRDLKQATMRQLITGETHLPGFSGEWEVMWLDELAEIRSGDTPSTGEPSFWDGDIPWCTPTDITALNGHKYIRETSRLITPFGLNASSAEMIPAQSVVMTSRATIGECAINAVPLSTNQGFKNFIPFVKTDVDFIYYMLGTQKQGLIALCGGSTFLEIGKTQLAAYEVRLPNTKAEHTAIATVLSEMDAELSVLESRRDKTRNIKQAMMQELLTGKTRLV